MTETGPRTGTRCTPTRWAAGVLLLAASGSGLFGCAGTQSWEREQLAKRKMVMAPDPEESLLEQHVYQYREGSAGGYAAGGGGCGCN